MKTLTFLFVCICLTIHCSAINDPVAHWKLDETLGLTRSQTTTQIEHYDNLAALFDVLKRINTIILDLDRDMWMYN